MKVELENLEEDLRQAIFDKGLKKRERNRLAFSAGMQPRQLDRFLKGETGLNSKTIQKLAKEL